MSSFSHTAPSFSHGEMGEDGEENLFPIIALTLLRKGEKSLLNVEIRPLIRLHDRKGFGLAEQTRLECFTGENNSPEHKGRTG